MNSYDMNRLTRAISLFLILASLAYPIFVFTIFPNWVIDDAFITFRYAENLAKSGEFTWNVGEPPIEGYTGVFLPAALAVFIKFGFDPINVSRAIGVFSFFLGWLMLFLSLRLLKSDKFVLGIILLLYSTTPILFTHASSGLETMLFIASILASSYFLLRFLLRGESAPLFLSLLLTSLVRPEGVALAGFFAAAAALYEFRQRRGSLKIFIIGFAIFYFVPALLYFLWRLNYYHALLPNTYYAKSDVGFSVDILIDIFRFLRGNFALPILAGIALLLPEIDWFWARIKSRAGGFWESNILYVFLPTAAFAALLMLFYARSHLTTNFSERFYTSLMPAMWLGLAFAFNFGFAVLNYIKGNKKLGYKLAIFLFFALSSYQILFHAAKLKNEITFANDEKTEKESQHYLAGGFLQKNLSPTDWVVIYLDAGAVPYFSKMKAVDFGALNDPVLARGKLSPKERIDYFYSKNPAAIFITSSSLERVESDKEAMAIAGDPRFQGYALAQKYPSPFAYRYPVINHQLLFLRNDIYSKLK
ncbi:MAG: hypothetical protein HYW15_01770 [Candidatus Giovannonibacteria bacterium]|nr:MAG: hypothetical protein HYW15_01770 [Candidatus Giovannonibacteria bacterium]